MAKALIASVCGLALLLSGCGGGNDADLKTACAKAKVARQQYREAGRKVGLEFLNAQADRRVVAAAAVFRTRAQAVQRLTDGSQAEQLKELDAALSQHEKLLTALAAHNLPEARKYADEIDARLDRTQANFEKICKSS